jgi:hypothetical protein
MWEGNREKMEKIWLRLNSERQVSWFIYNDYREKEGRKSRIKKKTRESIKLS